MLHRIQRLSRLWTQIAEWQQRPEIAIGSFAGLSRHSIFLQTEFGICLDRFSGWETQAQGQSFRAAWRLAIRQIALQLLGVYLPIGCCD
ncbi:MAG: hypothetical protein P8N14_00415 [Sulfitobacter sp.]|jgi:hypothetical protein|nr:hypothetical protein [Sulfitobacter sp.]